LLLSVVATLILAVAALTLLYSIVPSWKPRPPEPVPEPAQVSVSGSEINDYINRGAPPVSQASQPNSQGQAGNAAQNPGAPPAPPIGPEARSIANEIDAIRNQAVALKLPWANEYQTVCQQVFFGNCYRGVSGYIDQAFGHHNDGAVSTETVQVGAESYRINPSHHEAKMAILKELEGVLASAQPETARKLVAAWGKLREEKERERERALNAEQERRDQAYASAEMKYQRTVERKHRVRGASLYAAGLALGGFVFLGLILAVLAVERHTRLLEAQLALAKTEAVPPPLAVANP
jgi:hypothetical protein